MKGVDPEVMAEEAGYKRGYLECQSELSFKIKEVLNQFLHTGRYTPTEMATAIGSILDGK